jgi:hypothetical protein
MGGITMTNGQEKYTTEEIKQLTKESLIYVPGLIKYKDYWFSNGGITVTRVS